MSDVRRIIILGSTGSIGVQTLDVVDHLNDLHSRGEHDRRYEVVGLCAGRNADRLAEQAGRFPSARTALVQASGAASGRDAFDLEGADAAERLVREVDCDLVVAAVVGVAGLPSSLAAVELGRDLALANKETLVAAGSLVTAAASTTGAKIFPVDSEHAALWQCLRGADSGRGLAPVPPCGMPAGVSRLILTASGGPFRTWSSDRIEQATREMALAHPTWSMGAKVTIDSASLLNKGFELIEAHWLFGCPPERLAVVVHPQSIVHAMVEFHDLGVVAQMGPPDMRGPIQHAVAYPDRAAGAFAPLDLTAVGRLDFESPDTTRFPLLAQAFEAMRSGGSAGAVLNAASEVAVERFLGDDHARFGLVASTVIETIERVGSPRCSSLAEVLAVDAEARRVAGEVLAARC